MAIANVAAEVDLAKHWSFTLPVYYSTWDYFKSTIKFRTFAVQPEFRNWLSEENDGFFAGAHFGLAYYNFAFDGDYRYQDHNRETPASVAVWASVIVCPSAKTTVGGWSSHSEQEYIQITTTSFTIPHAQKTV